jgi:predicted fused transcriptional regulator/phosphomethylpyrimidine kinase
MEYELAKKLRDAGFDQELIGGFDATTFADGTLYPTLAELIMACGNEIMSIRKVWNENGDICNWIAESDGKGNEPIIAIGKNPEEAVAKLWLELNK